MILRLALAQARSQKRYAAWTAAFIALTLGLVTYAFALIETERGFDSLTARAYGLAGEHLGYADVMTGNPPESSRAPSNTSTEAIDAALDAAIADGSDVVAVRTAPFAVVENASSHVVWPSGWTYQGSTSTPYVGAVKGAYEWDLVLAEGEAPGHGEIALSADLAADLGVGIGDPVLAHLNVDQVTQRQRLGLYVPEHPLVVSGLLRTNAGLTTGPPWEMGALVSWDLSNEVGGLFTIVIGGGTEAPEALGFWGPDTWISYDRSSPALALFVDPMAGPDPWISDRSVTITPGSVYVLFPLAAILILGSFIGAFAVGRSQGQARVQWVATARTLGATRRSVRLASLAEAGLVAALGTVVGFSLGYGAAMIRLLWLRSRVPAPLAPTWVSVPWWVLGTVVGLGIALALVVGAAPAFWASRIPPVAAHKATADLAVVETSRRVPIRWLAIPFALGVGLILAGGGGSFGGTVLLTYGGIVAIPIAFVFLIEGLRRLVPVVGRRLARSRAVWTMVAGDAIASRPRQASTLASLAAIAGLFGTFTSTIWILGQREWFLEPGGGVGRSWSDFNGGPLGGWDDVTFGTAVGFLVAIQAICLAVTLSSLRVTAAEQATRQALGLTPGAGRAAAFAQHAVPQVVGGTVGGIVGLGVAWFIYFGTDINYANYSRHAVSEYLPAFGFSVVSSLAFAAIGLAIVGAGSVFASHAPKERTPIEALRPAGKVRAR